MSINYDFGDLEAFLAVKQCGSFHGAAARLNLSQSAVTRRIRKLEEALDCVLFERTTRDVRPTLAAKRLQARAEAILEDASETARAMRDESVAFAHQRNALVTIAAIPTVIAGLLLPAIRALQSQGDVLRIRLLDVAANAVAEAVASGEADFGICSIPSLDPTTHFEPLFDDPIVLALSSDHPLAAQAEVQWADLAKVPLILPMRSTGNRLLIDEAMARARVPLTWTFEVGRSTTALDLVRTGAGVAPLPRSAVVTSDACVRPLMSPTIVRSIGLISRIGQADSPMAKKLKEKVRSALSSMDV